jgi:AF2212-like protein
LWSERGHERWQTGVLDVRNRSQSGPEFGRTLIRWLLYTGTTMTIAVKAIYENGVFKPKEPLDFLERTEVEVLIPTQSPADDDPTGWAAARALIGFIDDAPADMAEHHDYYLYGRPRE